ncbi:Brefeldin A-inhibited guanine nucleotide-exchange protein 2, partial [Frankliniella fusca]
LYLTRVGSHADVGEGGVGRAQPPGGAVSCPQNRDRHVGLNDILRSAARSAKENVKVQEKENEEFPTSCARITSGYLIAYPYDHNIYDNSVNHDIDDESNEIDNLDQDEVILISDEEDEVVNSENANGNVEPMIAVYVLM